LGVSGRLQVGEAVDNQRRFICWDCCGLRYEAPDDNPMCPNCGGVGIIVPPEITFALDHIEIA